MKEKVKRNKELKCEKYFIEQMVKDIKIMENLKEEKKTEINGKERND